MTSVTPWSGQEGYSVPLEDTALAEAGGPVASHDRFSIGLFDLGDPKYCLYSFICPLCALASARTQMDDSDCIYNFFCLGHVPERWMIRTAYDIPGDPITDAGVAVCCFPCSVNQLYQSTKAYGNPTVNGGKVYNKQRFARPENDEGFLKRLCCAIFCTQCTAGAAMERGVGMPFWMGCCCMNMCTARNIIRYQHRVVGNDCIDECILPSLLVMATGASLLFVPLILCIAPVVVARSMQLQAQAQARPTQSRRYLVNDSIRQVPVPAPDIVVIQPTVVPATVVEQPPQYSEIYCPPMDISHSQSNSGANEAISNNLRGSEGKGQTAGVSQTGSGGSNAISLSSAAPIASPTPPTIPVATQIIHENRTFSLSSMNNN